MTATSSQTDCERRLATPISKLTEPQACRYGQGYVDLCQVKPRDGISQKKGIPHYPNWTGVLIYDVLLVIHLGVGGSV
ncbi:MAG: hypothetical protein GTN81_05275 [Proteobacteria bacterium]|nr:hypothetical protein [Pseudomonadota bacterium]